MYLTQYVLHPRPVLRMPDLPDKPSLSRLAWRMGEWDPQEANKGGWGESLRGPERLCKQR